MMSRDKLNQWLRYTMTAKQVNAAIDVFLVEVLRRAASFFCIRRVYYKTLIR